MRSQTGAKLVLRLPLQLPDALAGDVQVLPYLVERPLFPAQQSEAVANDVEPPLVEPARRAVHERVDFLVVDLLFLAFGLHIGEERRQPALLIAIDVIVDREFALQQRQDHRELLGPSPWVYSNARAVTALRQPSPR